MDLHLSARQYCRLREEIDRLDGKTFGTNIDYGTVLQEWIKREFGYDLPFYTPIQVKVEDWG